MPARSTSHGRPLLSLKFIWAFSEIHLSFLWAFVPADSLAQVIPHRLQTQVSPERGAERSRTAKAQNKIWGRDMSWPWWQQTVWLIPWLSYLFIFVLRETQQLSTCFLRMVTWERDRSVKLCRTALLLSNICTSVWRTPDLQFQAWPRRLQRCREMGGQRSWGSGSGGDTNLAGDGWLAAWQHWQHWQHVCQVAVPSCGWCFHLNRLEDKGVRRSQKESEGQHLLDPFRILLGHLKMTVPTWHNNTYYAWTTKLQKTIQNCKKYCIHIRHIKLVCSGTPTYAIHSPNGAVW